MSSSPVDKPLPLANTFDELSGPPVDVSVSDDSCPGCGDALEHEGVDVAYVTDTPAKPKTQVTEDRVQVCRCRGWRQTDTWTPLGLAIAVATRGLIFVAGVGLEETPDFETANITSVPTTQF